MYWGRGGYATFLATGEETNGAYVQAAGMVLPGGGPPPHIRHREDETLYLLEGRLAMHLGEVTVVARPGDHLPTIRP